MIEIVNYEPSTKELLKKMLHYDLERTMKKDVRNKNVKTMLHKQKPPSD